MKNLWLLSKLVFIAILLVSCTNSQSDTIKIGGAFGLTGDAADWGNDELRAVQLAIDQKNSEGGINGQLLELIVDDTQTDAKVTLSVLQKQIHQDKVIIIIGPTWGDSFSAVIHPVLIENQFVSVTPSAALETAINNDANSEYFFSTWYPQFAEINKHIEYYRENNYKKIAIIHDLDLFNTDFATSFESQLADEGFDVVGRFEIQPGESDFRTVLARIKDLNPDVIEINIFEVGELGSAVKQMTELGIDALVTSTASTQSNALVESYGDIVEDKIFYSFPDTSLNAYQQFESDFETAYGEKPSGASAGPAYDATRAVIAALETGARTGNEIKDALNSVKISGTIVQDLSFTPEGQITSAPFVMKTVQNSEFVVIG